MIIDRTSQDVSSARERNQTVTFTSIDKITKNVCMRVEMAKGPDQPALPFTLISEFHILPIYSAIYIPLDMWRS